METGYPCVGKLNNGETKNYHINIMPGDIVRIYNAGQQYSCLNFDRYFGCYGKTIHVDYDHYYRPRMKDKDNLWIVRGFGIHPCDTDKIIVSISNRRDKFCVIGIDGVKFFKHGPFTRKPGLLQQIGY
jgi:hypothetical protein